MKAEERSVLLKPIDLRCLTGDIRTNKIDLENCCFCKSCVCNHLSFLDLIPAGSSHRRITSSSPVWEVQLLLPSSFYITPAWEGAASWRSHRFIYAQECGHTKGDLYSGQWQVKVPSQPWLSLYVESIPYCAKMLLLGKLTGLWSSALKEDDQYTPISLFSLRSSKKPLFAAPTQRRCEAKADNSGWLRWSIQLSPLSEHIFWRTSPAISLRKKPMKLQFHVIFIWTDLGSFSVRDAPLDSL